MSIYLQAVTVCVPAVTVCVCTEDKLPEDAVSLSFWVASNLALSAADRLALFAVDDALLRLHMEVHFIRRVRTQPPPHSPLLYIARTLLY